MSRVVACLAVLLPLAAACDSGGNSPSAPAPARVAASVAPSPIVTRICACGPLVGELDFEAELVLTESAGTAASLTRLQISLRADVDGRIVVGGELPLDQGEVRIPAGGTLRHRFLLHFPGANQAVPATLDLIAGITDDAGRVSQVTTNVRLLPPPA